MDEERFDALTRVFARGRLSRRQALTAAVRRVVSAARPSVTGAGSRAKAQAVIYCQPTNTFTLPCEQLGTYGEQCGALCPDGQRTKFASGCTQKNVDKSQGAINSVRLYKEGNRHCAEARATWFWTANPKSASWTWQPEAGRCCPLDCEHEAVNFNARIVKHEQTHRDKIHSVERDINTVWNNRFFKECAANPPAAMIALTASILAARRQDESAADTRMNEEPPPVAPPNCNPCEAAEGRLCCGGVCITPTALAASSSVACGNTCCGPDQICCHGTCRNLLRDTWNCGGCDIACKPGQSCNNGTCECPADQMLCPGATHCVSKTEFICCSLSPIGYCTRNVNPGEGGAVCCDIVPTGCATAKWCSDNGGSVVT
jgi:hypothetical protein